MKWKKGRRGGGVEDRRADRRVEALLARNPTFMREVGPTSIMPDMRYGESMVSPDIRGSRTRDLRYKKGGVVGDGCIIKGRTRGKG